MTKCTRKIDWLCKQVESVLLEVEANSKYLKWDLQGTNTLKLFWFNWQLLVFMFDLLTSIVIRYYSNSKDIYVVLWIRTQMVRLGALTAPY